MWQICVHLSTEQSTRAQYFSTFRKPGSADDKRWIRHGLVEYVGEDFCREVIDVHVGTTVEDQAFEPNKSRLEASCPALQFREPRLNDSVRLYPSGEVVKGVRHLPAFCHRPSISADAKAIFSRSGCIIPAPDASLPSPLTSKNLRPRSEARNSRSSSRLSQPSSSLSNSSLMPPKSAVAGPPSRPRGSKRVRSKSPAGLGRKKARATSVEEEEEVDELQDDEDIPLPSQSVVGTHGTSGPSDSSLPNQKARETSVQEDEIEFVAHTQNHTSGASGSARQRVRKRGSSPIAFSPTMISVGALHFLIVAGIDPNPRPPKPLFLRTVVTLIVTVARAADASPASANAEVALQVAPLLTCERDM
ncbi:hypothetical protein GGX14DRAFT_384206 [Mycena pura]|uniref:Uncharacterized protein n=1 Tax=Mycena pura TaxID=153505 RepID=A0AAD7E5R1_9AGAR|nr:hypothetical protein GGX14DRAFT_384206 [Mycena pura]